MIHALLVAACSIWLIALLVLASSISSKYLVAFDLGDPFARVCLGAAVVGSGAAIAMQSDGMAAAIISTLLSCCALCAVTDSQSGLIFDGITYPSAALFLSLHIVTGNGMLALYGIGGIGLGFSALYTATKGRGIGLGDLKFGCCIGAALGTVDAAIAVGAAFVAGGAYGLWLLLSRRAKLGASVRFAPYLAAGVAVALLHRYIS